MSKIAGYHGLFGQEKAKKLIDRSLQSGRVPHGMLFRGPDGVGKLGFARGLAEVINCKNKRVATEACGLCSSCKKYQSGNHPDFMIVCPQKGIISIDSVRQLCKGLEFPPYESPLRVTVIEDVHLMRQEAANALLKSLEEPPEGNLLVLTADASQTVMATLLSRCQVIPFHSLSLDQTKEIVLDHLPGCTQEEASLLANLSEGSPGRAIGFGKTGVVQVLEKCLGSLHDHTGKGENIGRLLRLAEEMAGLKEDLLPLLMLFRIWYRDLLFFLHGQTERIINVSLVQRKLKNSHKNWSSAELFDKLQAIDRAEMELARNCNRSLVCEVLLFSLRGSAQITIDER